MKKYWHNLIRDLEGVDSTALPGGIYLFLGLALFKFEWFLVPPQFSPQDIASPTVTLRSTKSH